VDSPRSKDKPRHRSSKSSRKADKASTPPERRSSNTSPVTTKRRSSMPVPELERATSSNSPLGSKMSLPYPSFSKAHSKEAVGSRENVVNPRLSYYTPDPTDLEKGKEGEPRNGVPNTTTNAPPSPPETTMESKIRTEKPKVDTVKVERKRSDLQRAADELKKKLVRASSETGDRKERRSHSSRSRNSLRESSNEEGKSTSSAKKSKPGTPSKLRPRQPTVEDSASSTGSHLRPPSSVESAAKSEETTCSTIDSGATERPISPRPDRDSSPTTDPDSSPRTPTLTEPNFPPSRKETPAISVFDGPTISGGVGESPMPPPPPPPPQVLMPRVDYLMQHGGLLQPVPRTLLGALPPIHTSNSGPQNPPYLDHVFLPFHDLFDKYDKVMSRSGSLAVATGYRSVARRLLDRLEAVFSRDISSETCTCVFCQASADNNLDLDDERGVSWGEILEYVCGRQELPQWPPFVMDSIHTGLGISASENAPPMQKLDVDVPEEFRDHYVRQSKKTKQSVDKWLQSQPHQASSPPQDVDDDTLTFAMLTRMEPEQRPMFSSLVGVVPTRPASTAGEPIVNPSSDLLQKTGLAIQRLYRLASTPRDPESAMYLLSNPPLHNVLATLAAISDGEWDLLTSGRFDGFLRSGADDTPVPVTNPPSRGPSRGPPSRMGTQSIPPSRGPTPATAGAPITLDEETEIATIAEVEREIFLSMEMLENAFEALHLKAETVRRIMRERGAGLAQANQQRRGGTPFDPRMGTPASFAWESETDDGFDDGASELMPDDSASNISSSRHRRPKRRHERRTPAPVEEEDEEAFSDVGSKAGRRR